MYRGYKKRCQFDLIITNMELELARSSGPGSSYRSIPEPTTFIQAYFRGYLVRRNLMAMEEELAAIRIQVFNSMGTTNTSNPPAHFAYFVSLVSPGGFSWSPKESYNSAAAANYQG